MKNEEKNAARILKKVLKFADEIIVVDTGSSDKTKEIVGKFTNFKIILKLALFLVLQNQAKIECLNHPTEFTGGGFNVLISAKY